LSIFRKWELRQTKVRRTFWLDLPPAAVTTRRTHIGQRLLFQRILSITKRMDKSAAIAVLTAMITPAVLISACGSMILSTSTRLGRVVDRVRDLSDRLEALTEGERQRDMLERQALIFAQLDKLTSRARILQRCMVVFYLSLGSFVATSVAIGVAGFASRAGYNLIPVALGILGACFLFYGSVLLIFEARLALSTIHHEMDFIWQRSKQVAPAEVVDQHKPHFVHFRRRD
jgi:hypothetical protein